MNIIKILVLSVVLGSGFAAGLAQASEWKGRVVSIMTETNFDRVVFSLSGELKDTPRCNSEKVFVLRVVNPGDRLMYDILKLAVETGNMVSAKGAGTCDGLMDRENTRSIEILPVY